MAAAFKLSVQEQIYHIQRQPLTDNLFTEAQDVRIVVHTGIARAVCFRTACRSNAPAFIRRHAHANTGRTDKDAKGAVAVSYCMTYWHGIGGIMTAFCAAAAKIHIWDPLLVKIVLNRVFQMKAAVIAAYCNFHNFFHFPFKNKDRRKISERLLLPAAPVPPATDGGKRASAPCPHTALPRSDTEAAPPVSPSRRSDIAAALGFRTHSAAAPPPMQANTRPQ